MPASGGSDMSFDTEGAASSSAFPRSARSRPEEQPLTLSAGFSNTATSLEPAPEASRTVAIAGRAVAVTLSGIGCAAVLFMRSTHSPAGAASPLSELYNKEAAYGKTYGQLAGDDMVQKSWPGLTCDRTDDDKWGWGEATATADNSGTNCVYGDSWFCEDHYSVSDAGVMLSVSQLMWHYCNSTCNSTDEALVSEYGDSATLKGTSMLAGCAFDGLKNMEEVCHVNNEHFVPFSHRALGEDFNRQHRLRLHPSMGELPMMLPGDRALSNNYAPSVPIVNDTVIWINETYQQDACNTHALCSTCITGANGTLDPYCEAFMVYYDMSGKWLESGISRSHKYNVQLFWLNVHFWCNQTVLESIKEGTFATDLQSGKIKNYDHISVATNNTQANLYFGGDHVHEPSDYHQDYDDKR